MNMESIVTPLKDSKKLYELGVKQESIFYWADGYILGILNNDKYLYINDEAEKSCRNIGCGCCSYSDEIKEIYSAYTLSELTGMFQVEICSGRDQYGKLFCKAPLPDGNEIICYYDTEIGAKSNLIIKLIELGVIKI